MMARQSSWRGSRVQQTPLEPTPLTPTSARYPGLSYVPGDPSLKKGDAGFKNRIVADDHKFNIFDVPDPLNDNIDVPINDIEPFSEYSLKVAMFDIESVGADGGECLFDGTDVIVAIGVKFRDRHYIACSKERSEQELLVWFYKQLEVLYSAGLRVLCGQNIYGYDLGMIHDCSQRYGLYCPWRRNKTKWDHYRWSNAVVNGRSLELPRWDCDCFELIDTYPQVVLYDTLVRKLNSYSLKDAVIGFGLRDDRRLEIGADVWKFWRDGDTATISEYLKYDLDDTESLWNYLIPQRYFMRSYLDWSLTRVTTTGSGSWWSQYLVSLTGNKPNRTQTASYQGALTYYHSGVFRNVVKFDFSSLYPSIMLTWLVCSDKDQTMMALRVLQFILNRRKQLKKLLEETGDAEYDGQQMTAKVLANSLYGVLNTMGLAYNDPYAGAAVTAYGRQLARFMIKFLIDRGCQCLAVDTDGALITTDRQFDSTQERMDYFADLNRQLNAALPGVTKVDYEADFGMVFVPRAIDKKSGKILAEKLSFIGEVDPDTLEPGLSKNYLMFELNRKHFAKTGDEVYKLVRKGKFKKRDKSWLESGLITEWFTKLFYDGQQAANGYLSGIRDQISSGDFDVNLLRKTVLVASNWKEFPRHGFKAGHKYTVHYVWDGATTGKRKVKKVCKPCSDPAVNYDIDYYITKFDDLTKLLPGWQSPNASKSMINEVDTPLLMLLAA